MADSTEVVGADAVPSDLLTAFERYEAAIVANDLDDLDASFAPGPDTLRGDGAGLLVGHEAISSGVLWVKPAGLGLARWL